MKSNFATYYTSTVVTSDYVYVVTIKDVAAWAAQSANMNTLQSQFESLLVDYKKDFDFLTDYQRQEKALMELVGDFVNIYRSDKTTDLDFKPLQLDADQLSEINPCD